MAKPLVLLTEPLPEPWIARLRAQCDLVIGVNALPEDAASRLQGILSMLNFRVDDRLLERFAGLRVVSNMAVGYDNIDLHACARRGLRVGHTPGVLTDATADLALGLLIAAARGLRAAADDAREGRWGAWSPTRWLGAELRGETLGIVGFGSIGAAVARRARAFGLELVYSGPRPKPEAEALGARKLPLPELLARARFVSLHCPLRPATRHLLDREAIARMRADAYLINTARGEVVDQDALVDALTRGAIAGAALDVTTPEPLPAEHALFGLRNALVVPHIGSATERTRAAMAELAVTNLLAGLDPATPLAHAVPLPS